MLTIHSYEILLVKEALRSPITSSTASSILSTHYITQPKTQTSQRNQSCILQHFAIKAKGFTNWMFHASTVIVHGFSRKLDHCESVFTESLNLLALMGVLCSGISLKKHIKLLAWMNRIRSKWYKLTVYYWSESFW